MPQLAVAIVVVGLIQGALTGQMVVIPVFLGHAGESTWSMFLPVVVGVTVADSLASRTQGVEARVAGHVLLLDVALLAGVTGAASTTLVVLGGTHPQPVGTIGQVMITAGLAAAATLWWGLGAGVMAPLAVVVACLAYGRDAPGGGYIRVLAPDGLGWWDLVVGCLALGAAIAMILTRTVRVGFRLADRLTD